MQTDGHLLDHPLLGSLCLVARRPLFAPGTTPSHELPPVEDQRRSVPDRDFGYRPQRTTTGASDGVRVFEKATPDGDQTAEFARKAVIPLSAEEEAVLREHGFEQLSRVIAQAEQAYVTASPAELAEADHRYLMLLNLAAKFTEPGPEPSEDEKRAHSDYLRLVEARRRRLDKFDPNTRAARLQNEKEAFFGSASAPTREGVP
jgi:hypothetical protein